MLDLREFAKEVHQNAVEHGFWESDNQAEKIVLIHAEWSEALESYRNGESALWYRVMTDRTSKNFYRKKKPEGWAVELIDGCIRIFDLLEHERAEIPHNLTGCVPETEGIIDLPDLVVRLHFITSQLYAFGAETRTAMRAVALACAWVRQQVLDPDKLMWEKHEYNKIRPYKHGKMF